jgi:predicted component of type VI protein secretion system
MIHANADFDSPPPFDGKRAFLTYGVALAALLGVILSGCASSDPKPATGVMLDPVWHTEVHDVTVDTE